MYAFLRLARSFLLLSMNSFIRLSFTCWASGRRWSTSFCSRAFSITGTSSPIALFSFGWVSGLQRVHSAHRLHFGVGGSLMLHSKEMFPARSRGFVLGRTGASSSMTYQLAGACAPPTAPRGAACFARMFCIHSDHMLATLGTVRSGIHGLMRHPTFRNGLTERSKNSASVNLSVYHCRCFQAASRMQTRCSPLQLSQNNLPKVQLCGDTLSRQQCDS